LAAGAAVLCPRIPAIMLSPSTVLPIVGKTLKPKTQELIAVAHPDSGRIEKEADKNVSLVPFRILN